MWLRICPSQTVHLALAAQDLLTIVMLEVLSSPVTRLTCVGSPLLTGDKLASLVDWLVSIPEGRMDAEMTQRGQHEGATAIVVVVGAKSLIALDGRLATSP